MERGEISIADLLWSLARLKPGNAEALEALCSALHFELAREPTPAPAALEPEPSAPAVPLTEDTLLPAIEGGPSELRPLPPREEAPLPWANVEPLPVHPPSTDRPGMDPLILPLGRTAILSAAIATRDEAGEVDIGGTLEAIAAGRVLPRIPRLSVPSLRRGVQVLADVGEGMLPYASDRGEIIEALRRLLGKEQLELAMFAGTPLRKVGRGPRHRWQRWTPPPRGTPVLLLTDLGIGGPLLSHDRASLGEWLRFCEEVQRAACPLVAFVPYERHRWPPELARFMTLLHWDRGMTVSVVRHTLGHGDRRHP